MQDPFQIINSLESQQKHDFIGYDDSKHQTDRLPCFGFLFIRSNQASLQVWGQLLQQMAKRPQNEQVLMQGIMKHERVAKFRFLPAEQFRNGVLFGGNGGKFQQPARRHNHSNLAFVHANWVIGVESKTQMLRHHGWWRQ